MQALLRAVLRYVFAAEPEVFFARTPKIKARYSPVKLSGCFLFVDELMNCHHRFNNQIPRYLLNKLMINKENNS